MPTTPRSTAATPKPASHLTRKSRDVDVVCEFTCEDPEAILELADDFGKLAADLWLAGKLG